MQRQLMETMALAIVLSGAGVALAESSAPAVSNLGNVRGGDIHTAQSIISKKCIRCHSARKIDAALSSKKDMLKIQQEMEKKGAELNTNEREVLGIYWKRQHPLK